MKGVVSEAKRPPRILVKIVQLRSLLPYIVNAFVITSEYVKVARAGAVTFSNFSENAGPLAKRRLASQSGGGNYPG